MSARTYVCDSRYRFAGTPSNFVARYQNPFNSGLYRVLFTNITNGVYNVSTHNNKVYYEDDSLQQLVATVDVGNYNASTILIAMNNALAAAKRISDGLGSPSNAVTVIYSPTLNKIQFQSGTNFRLLFGTYNTNSMNFALGCANEDTVAGTSFIPPYQLDLGRPHQLLFRIRECHNDETLSNRDSSFGGVIENIYSPFGTQQVTYFRDFPRYLYFPQRTRVLTVTVLDARTLQEVDLGNDFSFMFQPIS